MPENHVRYFRVPHREMVYLKFITEAHEGLATLSTVDKLEGIVRLSFDPTVEPSVRELVEALQGEISMSELPRETYEVAPIDSDLR